MMVRGQYTYIYYYYYRYAAQGQFWAETTAQSGDWCQYIIRGQ